MSPFRTIFALVPFLGLSACASATDSERDTSDTASSSPTETEPGETAPPEAPVPAPLAPETTDVAPESDPAPATPPADPAPSDPTTVDPEPADPDAPPPADPAAPADPVALPFPPVSDFAAPGPYPVTVAVNVGPGIGYSLYQPTNLGEGGLRHPIVTWGNGTFMNPGVYDALLRHLASHGFVVIASNSSNTGTAVEMLQGIDWLLAENGSAASALFGKLDAGKIGASGHSQGGGGTLMAGGDPRVVVTAPLEPWITGFGIDPEVATRQHGPMFLQGGSNDAIATTANHADVVFAKSNVPTFYGILQGADHMVSATGDVTGFRGPMTAWFRLWLMGDESARPLFYGSSCGLCTTPTWTVHTKSL